MQRPLKTAALLSLYKLLFFAFYAQHAFATVVESESAANSRNILLAVALPDILVSNLNETLSLDQHLLDASHEPDISTPPILAGREQQPHFSVQEQPEQPSPEVEMQSKPLGPQFQNAAVEEAEMLQSPDATDAEPFINFALEQSAEADGGLHFSADLEESISPQPQQHFETTPSFSEERRPDDATIIIVPSPRTPTSFTSGPDFKIDEIELDSFSPAPSVYQDNDSTSVLVTIVADIPTPHFTLTSQADAQQPQLHAGDLDSSPEGENIFAAIEGEGSIVAVTPSSLPSPTPLLLVEDVSVLPSISPEDGGEETWAEIPLSVSRAQNTFTRDIDASIRWYSANATGTSESNWRLVSLTGANNSTQRQQHTPILAVYHALLHQEDAGERLVALEEDSNDGSFGTYLREQTSDQSLTIAFAGTPFLNVVPETDIAGEETPLLPTSSSEVNGNSADGSDSSAKDPADGKVKIGIILASSLTGIALIAACLFAFRHYRKDPDRKHLIDGVAEIPSTISSVASTLTDSGSSIFNTGAPVRPRGPTMLYNQSRILGWQMEQHGDASLEIPISKSFAHRRKNTEESGYVEEKAFGRTEALSGEVID